MTVSFSLNLCLALPTFRKIIGLRCGCYEVGSVLFVFICLVI